MHCVWGRAWNATVDLRMIWGVGVIRPKVSVISMRPTISTLNDIFTAQRFLISGTFSLWHPAESDIPLKPFNYTIPKGEPSALSVSFPTTFLPYPTAVNIVRNAHVCAFIFVCLTHIETILIFMIMNLVLGGHWVAGILILTEYARALHGRVVRPSRVSWCRYQEYIHQRNLQVSIEDL